jgi:hypothetical protein
MNATKFFDGNCLVNLFIVNFDWENFDAHVSYCHACAKF